MIDEIAQTLHDELRRHWPRSLADRRLARSEFVPEGQVYYMAGTYYVGPLTFWSFAHGFRWPMLSIYSRGMLELDRDRRRRAKR